MAQQTLTSFFPVRSAAEDRVCSHAGAREEGDASGTQLPQAAGGKRKRQSATTNKRLREDADEVDLEHTEGEEESEDEMNRDDEAFIDDCAISDDGQEQVRCEQENYAAEDMDGADALEQAIAAVKRPVGRPRIHPPKAPSNRKRGRPPKHNKQDAHDRQKHNTQDAHDNEAEEPEDKSAEKKPRKRSDRLRSLLVTCERGIGNVRRSVGEYHLKKPFHLPLADFVTAWELQPQRVLIDFGLEIGKLGRGAFGNEMHRRWVNDIQVQREFATRFFVPISENIPLRALSTDVQDTCVPPHMCRTNSTSKVLHGFRAMHRQTELDNMNNKFYEKVLIGQQRTSRELRQMIDGGPFGGLQGKAVDVLWRVYAGEEVTNLSEQTLQLVQAISMALQGSKGDELWCMVNTDVSEFYVRGKTGMSKVQSGVHTVREYNFQQASKHAGRFAVDDIDKRILKKVWRFRFPNEEVPLEDKEKLLRLVDSRYKNDCPELAASAIPITAQPPTIDPVIVDLWVYKDIFAAWDENTQQRTNVTVEGIYVLGKCAACDPLLILKSIAENNPTASTLLLETFSHMLQVLGMQKCSWDQLFSTDSAGAAYAVSEARMLEGIFKFCDSHKLRNVNVGGMRLDASNQEEMLIWEQYIRTITSSRTAHYEMMTRETLNDRKHIKDAQLPYEHFPHDLVHGLSNWKVSVSRVQAEMEEYIQTYEDIEEQDTVRFDLQDWFSSHEFEDDPETGQPLYMFIREGVGFTLNTGLWIKIRTDNSRSHDEDKYENIKKKDKNASLSSLMPQPQQQNNLVRLWCGNMSETSDPLDEIFCHSAIVPDLRWMVEQMPKMDTIGESVVLLREMIGDEVLVTAREEAGHNARVREILQLAGKERNPLRERIHNIEENTKLEFLFRVKMNKILASIKHTLQIMRASELVQWRIAALGVSDLQKQDKSMQDKWQKDYAHVSEAFEDSLSWRDWLSVGATTAIFYTHSNKRIDSNLSFMNTMLQRLMMLCFMTHNMNTPGAYGMTLRVGDMACSVNIIKEMEVHNRKGTSVCLYDPKHPGMGIDQCTGNLGQQCNAGMIHLSLTKEHKDMASLAVDTSLRNVSKMSYATLQGSGVLVNCGGEIVNGNTDFTRKCGKCCYFTEYGKQADDNVMMGWMESLMANSGDQELGGESGVQQGAWTTTQNLESSSVLQIKKLPVLLITGNRPTSATPASAVEGARWMNIASSTMDGDNGFTKVLLGHAECVQPNLPGNSDDDCVLLATLTNSMCRGDVRKDIKIIGREIVLRNRLHFLLMQWLKTDAVLVCSALTSEPKRFVYSLMSNFSNIECSVAQLTGGLRREYLNKDSRFWHRNAAGPWDKVMKTSMHVYMAMSTSLLTCMDRVQLGFPVDLTLAFELGIKAVMTETIPFMAMITSLHMWLASAVLDINIMILACYMYHFSGFQNTCSLRVLSLAILGLLRAPDDENADSDWAAYVAFCEEIAPLVLSRRMRQGANNPSRPGARNVAQGTLPTPSLDTLQTWASWSVPALQKDIFATYKARTDGQEQQKLSVYCQPRPQFVFRDTIKGFGRNKEMHFAADENICGTSTRVLGSMYGKQQTQQSHLERTNSMHLESHENTYEFWNQAQLGTALPRSNTSTNDVFKMKFEFVPYTGIWWDETMHNAGYCDGLMKLFLVQSRLSPKTTHYQFFKRLLTPYLQHTRSTDDVYGGPSMTAPHQNAWSSCVLDKHNVFQFCSNPHFDQQFVADGISINMCMRLTHFVLFQGIGMTQDWDRNKHENAAFVSCVHLRNMSSMSLGCLSLLLHTACDKALIPVNSGKLLLPMPSPVFESKEEAQIEYDHRLHIDTHLHKMGGASDNMLSVSARMATYSNWRLLEIGAAESALSYTHVLADHPVMNLADSRALLFPFPPESVAHTAFMFDDLFLANRRHIEHLLKNDADANVATGSKLAEAMLCLGGSIRLEDFQHKQPSLTECAVRDRREIPCVSLQHGFMFTICFEEDVLHIRKCFRTHKWAAIRQDREYEPFMPLPLKNGVLGVVVESKQFRHLFRHGLCMDSDNLVTVNLQATQTAKRLPFYMFPVLHFPILVLLQHSGWLRDGMLLHTHEYFQTKHYSEFDIRDCAEDAQHNVATNDLFLECKRALPDLCMHACYADEHSTQVHCFWLQYKDQVKYYATALEITTSIASNTLMDMTSCVANDAAGTSYLMLQHEENGLVYVLCNDKTLGNLEARFSYSDENDEQVHKNESFTMAFEQFKPRLLPHDEECSSVDNVFDAVWGLIVENTDGAFLKNGSYTVSSMVSKPCRQQAAPSLMHMDFISVSRSILIEGSEVWIRITAPVYASIQLQAQEQGYTVKLPVSANLHENMQGLRYLRAFYVLGGSMHDTPINTNVVRLICTVSNTVHNQKAVEDDDANADSAVNKQLHSKNIRLVAFSLPVLESDGACILTRDRDSGAFFYKYLRARS